MSARRTGFFSWRALSAPVLAGRPPPSPHLNHLHHVRQRESRRGDRGLRLDRCRAQERHRRVREKTHHRAGWLAVLAFGAAVALTLLASKTTTMTNLWFLSNDDDGDDTLGFRGE